MTTSIQESETREVDHQIARAAWALLFIVIGALMLFPTIPNGTWLIATGLILLGAQAVRFFNGIRMRTFSLVLGIATAAFGVAAFVGADLPIMPIVLILIGVSIVLPEAWAASTNPTRLQPELDHGPRTQRAEEI